MKRIAFFLILLLFTLTSCYPPRIIYSIEGFQPSFAQDSINVRLLEGSTITTGGSYLYLNLYLEIASNREGSVFINKNSTLELQTDSTALIYDICSDTLVYALNKNEIKLLKLHFNSEDRDHITYKTVEWPSMWSFCSRKMETPRHKLFLYLDIQDKNKNKMGKYIVLKPTETKRLKYKKPPF